MHVGGIFTSMIQMRKKNTERLSEYFKITEPTGSRTSPALLKQYFIKTMKFTNSPDKHKYILVEY